MSSKAGVAGSLDSPPARTQTVLRRISRKQLVLFLAALLLAAGATALGRYWWTTERFIESTNDAYVGGDVTEISPHVSGFISEIAVADNQYVHAGQLLIRIAPADFQASRQHALALVQEERASMASLRAKIALQRSLIVQAQAELAASRARQRYEAADATRYEDLVRSGAVSIRELQQVNTAYLAAQAAVRAAQARLNASRDQLSVLDAAVGEALASVHQAEAQLETARLNLGYTELRSPIEGYVGDRSAHVGAYIIAGTQLLSIVPAHSLWVDANFKEDDIAGMRPGQPATIVADVDRGRIFRGHVVSLAPATGAVFSVIPPENATGNFTKIVQRVPVRIELDAVDASLGVLRPGLSVTAKVNTKLHHVTRS